MNTLQKFIEDKGFIITKLELSYLNDLFNTDLNIQKAYSLELSKFRKSCIVKFIHRNSNEKLKLFIGKLYYEYMIFINSPKYNTQLLKFLLDKGINPGYKVFDIIYSYINNKGDKDILQRKEYYCLRKNTVCNSKHVLDNLLNEFYKDEIGIYKEYYLYDVIKNFVNETRGMNLIQTIDYISNKMKDFDNYKTSKIREYLNNSTIIDKYKNNIRSDHYISYLVINERLKDNELQEDIEIYKILLEYKIILSSVKAKYLYNVMKWTIENNHFVTKNHQIINDAKLNNRYDYRVSKNQKEILNRLKDRMYA